VHPFVAKDDYAMLRNAENLWIVIEGSIKSDAALTYIRN